MARRFGGFALAAAVLGVALWVGAPLRHGPPVAGERPPPPTPAAPPGSLVCPMHPQVTSDDSGARCPVCGMGLVKRDATAGAPFAPAHVHDEPGDVAAGEVRAVGFVTREPREPELLVVADLASPAARLVAAGQTAHLEVATRPGRSFVGRVRAVGAASSESGATRVWLTFAGPGLEPGMYGPLRIETARSRDDAATRAGTPGAPR